MAVEEDRGESHLVSAEGGRVLRGDGVDPPPQDILTPGPQGQEPTVVVL